ncbi:MAG: hypothetical protein ACRC8S_20565 [Fimbriiglobus sp.]
MSRAQKFWNWFQANTERLMAFEENRNVVFSELSKQLQYVDFDLTFEFGPNREGVREFIISAGGIKALIPTVESLVASAPMMPTWHVIAFRQRKDSSPVVMFGGVEFSESDIQCSLVEEDDVLHLDLYLPGYSDETTHLITVGFLFLDAAIGEYDVMKHIGPIAFHPTDAAEDKPRFPFAELRSRFDALRGESD